ncbi:hypothetical protein TWF730_008059 [Orbilia blumenaviensis]|uniref:Clr5 domain-containing protein n=1 Tax=Orbilia blumenaviensis TaxID=1796055 RepID=A0AAV9V9S7_9PEZI
MFKFFTGKKRDYVLSNHWNEHKAFIEERLANNSLQEIIDALKNERGVIIKMHQLKKCLGEWGLGKRNLMRRQRHFIWNVFQQHKSSGTNPSQQPVFFFKSNKQAVPKKQVDEILSGDGSEFLGPQSDEGAKSPGLDYSLPSAIDDSLVAGGHSYDQVGVSENRNGQADHMAISATNGMNSNSNSFGTEVEQLLEPGAKVVNSDEHSPETLDESGEAPDASKPVGATEENLEAVQTICQEILDSVDSAHTAVSEEAEAKQAQPRDYSAEFAVELENRIAAEKRVAALFLQEMEEERTRSGGAETLDLSECYSRVRARWYQKQPNAEDGLLPEDFDPLPLSIYQQLHQLDSDPRKQVRNPNKGKFPVWEEMRVLYAQYIDEAAKFCLSHPTSHRTNARFQCQAAHFLILAKRFGAGHYFSIKAFTIFAMLVSLSAMHRFPIQMLYKVLYLLKRLGMQTHLTTIAILQCIYGTILYEINESNNNDNVKYLIPLSRLWYRVLEFRVRHGGTMQVVYQQYSAIHRLGTAHLLNQENETGLSIIRHARAKMLRVPKPATTLEWWSYGASWYRIGISSMTAGLPLEAKSDFQSAYECFQQIITKDNSYRDYSFNCLTWMGEACGKLGEYKLAIENEKAFMDFRKEYFGVKDEWYLHSIQNATEYMERRGLVRYSQPILQLTIETCEAAGIDEESYRKLLNMYYGRYYFLDKSEFDAPASGFPGWSSAMQLD